MKHIAGYKLKAMREFTEKLSKTLINRGIQTISPVQLANAHYVVEGWIVKAQLSGNLTVEIRLYGDFPSVTKINDRVLDQNVFAFSYEEATYLRKRINELTKNAIRRSDEDVLRLTFSIPYETITVTGRRGTKVMYKGLVSTVKDGGLSYDNV